MFDYCSTLTGTYIESENYFFGTVDVYSLSPSELDRLLAETGFLVWVWQSFKLSFVMGGFVSTHAHDWRVTILAWTLNIVTLVMSVFVPILPAVFIIIIYLYAYRHYVMYEEKNKEYPRTFLLRVVQ